ncbi:hypothetical protein [Rheinheimera baltica]|uniref:hypothetical protein n=1 Tax=Rheinheimera baltica TaxID=67576 RepID=UPI000404FB7B|nr:hypothetical protein [Rheinheimera baltica]
MLNYETLLSPSPLCNTPLISEVMVVAAIFFERNRIWLLPYITEGEHKTKFPDRKPVEFDLADIVAAIDSGDLKTSILDLPEYKKQPDEHAIGRDGEPLPCIKERDRRFAIVVAAMTDEDELFYSGHGESVVARVAQAFSSTPRNVQRYLNEYFRGGRLKNALITKRGRHERKLFAARKKVGKPRNTSSLGYVGKNVEQVDVDKMSVVLKKYYLNSQKISLAAVYEKLLEEQYAAEKQKIYPDGSTSTPKLLSVNERISLNQFYDWMPVALGLRRENISAKRRPAAKHKSDNQGRTGDGNYIALGPGHIFQLDSTEVDIKVVSPYDRRVVLSKITIYSVRDVYTRAFVGIHVASGKASWYEARIALFNTFRNKKQVAQECGLIIDEDDWIESGIPSQLLVDNEEFANKISGSVGKDLSLIVIFGRAYSGDDKGLVESSFAMFHAMMKNEQLPGFEYKELIGRNRQLPHKTAALTPRELQQILFIYAIYHNQIVWKDNYPMEQQASQDGVKDVCRDYWLWGLKNRGFFLRNVNMKTLYLSLLEVGELTVHRTHLMLKGKHLKYCCEDVRIEGLQNRREGRAKKPVLSCRYLRSTVNKILIELNGKFVVGHLASEQMRYKDMSHNEFESARLRNSEQKGIHIEDNREKAIEYSRIIRSIGKHAFAQREQHFIKLDGSRPMDAATAGGLLREESYSRENKLFDQFTSELVGQNVSSKVDNPPTNQTKHDIPNKASDEAEPSADESNHDEQSILDIILQEIGHG